MTNDVLPLSFAIGGELPVRRLGLGTMNLTGPGVWGEPRDVTQAIRLLRRAVELGVTLVDTADSHGPEVGERLIRQALHPYPDGLVIAGKAGLARTGPGRWHPLGRPEYLRQQVELSLRHLALDRIDLFQLHRIDPRVPLADQLGALADLRREGKIRHLGLCEVDLTQLRQAREITPIATVQNRYNLADRRWEQVLEYCTAEGIGFLPWQPLQAGELACPGGPLAGIATGRETTPAQFALAWLLHRSPVLLPIPGTSRQAHLEENLAAAQVQLSEAEFRALSAR